MPSLRFAVMPSFLSLSSSIAPVRHDQVEKTVGLSRIEASQFPDGIQGGCPVSGKDGSDPEEIPGVGKRRVETDDLTVGRDGVIVAIEGGVREPEAVPGVGSLRVDTAT